MPLRSDLGRTKEKGVAKERWFRWFSVNNGPAAFFDKVRQEALSIEAPASVALKAAVLEGTQVRI
jgi:hypothetical protein